MSDVAVPLGRVLPHPRGAANGGRGVGSGCVRFVSGRGHFAGAEPTVDLLLDDETDAVLVSGSDIFRWFMTRRRW